MNTRYTTRRAAAFAAGFGGLLLALSLLCFGTSPLGSFVRYALPRLSSGAAFPFMDTESGILTNLSPFGIPFKLRFLGLDVRFRCRPGTAPAAAANVPISARTLLGFLIENSGSRTSFFTAASVGGSGDAA